MIIQIILRILLWLAFFMLRWLLLPSTVVVIILLHPPTLASLVTKLGNMKMKNQKIGSGPILTNFSVKAIHLFRFRVDEIKATLIDHVKQEASILLIDRIEMRPTLKV